MSCCFSDARDCVRSIKLHHGHPTWRHRFRHARKNKTLFRHGETAHLKAVRASGAPRCILALALPLMPSTCTISKQPFLFAPHGIITL
jgi:hypothetical protein